MIESADVDAGSRLFCSFRAEGRLYGIDIAQVREVSAQLVFTPVAHAPTAIRGLANLRSRVYLVVDVRPLLGLPPIECGTDSRLIILKPHLAENLGVLVEIGGDTVRVDQAEIEVISPTADVASDDQGGPRPDVIVGVCKLDGELMNIIDSVKLIKSVGVLMQ